MSDSYIGDDLFENYKTFEKLDRKRTPGYIFRTCMSCNSIDKEYLVDINDRYPSNHLCNDCYQILEREKKRKKYSLLS